MSKRVFQVHEHGTLAIGQDGLTSECVEGLYVLAARARSFFTEEGGPRGYRALRFRELVGVVQLRSGTTIEILPKVDGVCEHDRINLTHLLANTGQMPNLNGDIARYASGGTVFDAYLDMAADRAWALLRQGLSRAYIAEEQMSPFIRGRWLVARQLARSPQRIDRHELSVSTLTSDTPLNRVLKCGLGLMARFAADQSIAAKLRTIELQIDEVEDIAPAIALNSSVGFNRLNQAWQPLYEVIRQFLEKAMPFLAHGDRVDGLSWLFDMNVLFESYVASRLRHLCWPTPVSTQGPDKAIAVDSVSGRQAFYLRPDLIVGQPSAVSLVADTKWKQLGDGWLSSIDPSDVRQVYAYGRLYQAPRVALIYPASSRSPRMASFNFADAGPTLELIILEIPMFYDTLNKTDSLISSLVF